MLNSLLNRLIYTVKIRIFRVAFIQMLARKTLEQAKEHEQRIFGSSQIGAEKKKKRCISRLQKTRNYAVIEKKIGMATVLVVLLRRN